MAPTPTQIQVNSLKRLMKDHIAYSREVFEAREALDEMRLSNAEAHDLNQQNKLLQESIRMVRNVEKTIDSHRTKLLECLQNGAEETASDDITSLLSSLPESEISDYTASVSS